MLKVTCLKNAFVRQKIYIYIIYFCLFEDELAARQELAHHLAASSTANGRHPHHHQPPHGGGGRAATKCLRSVDSVFFFCEILHFNEIIHFENFSSKCSVKRNFVIHTNYLMEVSAAVGRPQNVCAVTQCCGTVTILYGSGSDF
jgi:hypothetical protein